MLKRLQSSRRLMSPLGALAAAYIRFIYRTSKVIREPADIDKALLPHHPMILAMWHGQFMMVPSIHPLRDEIDMAVMISRHGDAELMRQILSRFGYRLLMGAGAGDRRRDRGGAAAMRAALKALRNGMTVKMTADVPPGPFRQAGPGIIAMARLSGRPILPCAAATRRHVTFDTWNRFTLNLSFSDLAVVVGDPIHVPRRADEAVCEAARRDLTSALNAVNARAWQLAGVEPDPVYTEGVTNRPRPGRSLRVYRRLSFAAEPVLPLLLRYRGRRGKEDRARARERYGEASQPRPAGPLAWFHAASVGETNAVLPLITGLAGRRRDVHLLLTTGTTTSAKLALSRLPDGAVHQYVPFDTPRFIGRFLDHWRPDLAVLAESEIWPNLILEAAERDIPMVLVNARMSKRSFRRWRLWAGVSRPLFSRLELVVAQDDTLRRRFMQLGAPNVIAAGNLKFDAPPPPADAGALARLRSEIGNRPLFLAASTHPGEDEIVTEVHAALAARHPSLLTVIVPRHPHRGPAIAAMAKRGGLRPSLRSRGEPPGEGCDIYIADTIGELGLFYALAPVAFVGGSLVRHGGQNPVEAIKHGCVVLTGPSVANFAQAYAELRRRYACGEVTGADDLAAQADALLRDPEARRKMARAGEASVRAMSGALATTMAALLERLPPPEGK